MAPPLRVLVDAFFYGRSYGFGRVARELSRTLDLYAPDIEPIILVPTDAAPAAKAALNRARVISRDERSFPIWEQFVVPSAARSEKCAVVHFPYQSMSLFWPPSAATVTIHDLEFLRSASTASTWKDWVADFYRRVLFLTSTRRAASRLAVSEATRAELLSYAGIESTLVPNSAEYFIIANRDVPPAEGLGRFFTHRGGGPNKNTARVIEAFNMVRETEPDISLFIYGAPKIPPEGLPQAKGITYFGKLSDERLAALFKAATAVLCPSVEEGFGLSIVEAFGFGAPAITSNKEPMKDVAGSAAILVDPLDSTSIASAMKELLRKPALREAKRQAGFERYAHSYSAAQHGQDLTAAYKRAAQCPA